MSVTQRAVASSENEQWAREIIGGAPLPDVDEVLRRAKGLKGEYRFDLARRVLALADVQEGHPRYTFIHQQIANCTYKDEDIPIPHRYQLALEILREKCALETTLDTETLGLGGAVYKRLWEYGGQREHLERSLTSYHKAHEQNPRDEGWVAINTAFVLDLLAAQEAKTVDGIAPNVPQQRFAEAHAIRAKLLADLVAAAPEKPSWWYCATIAEAALGTGQFETAVDWLRKGTDADAQPWERASTARQLAVMVRVQWDRLGDDYGDAAQAVLEAGLGITRQTVKSVLLGKVGLALSGGGMRAALFHIGMLAKLAELDVLRHVEVISCVSGGSIVGAFYYLELKKRLEAKASLSQDDYIDVVQTVEREFLAGVQQNIRTRVASNFFRSLEMATVPGYSRSTRTGELYESQLYKRVDGIGKRELRQVRIDPFGSTGFNPKYGNWTRDSKVPILVLNATTVNTGHNWQFTATWMGESPQAINGAVDAIPRLERMYIDGRNEIPDQFRKFRLGHAVAASAGVPGLFEPVVMRKLYPDRTVRLVDGGVHDNQGLASLIEQSCAIMLVSDASGQMTEAQNPGGGAISVSLRTNGILQARVREAQYNELQTMRRSGVLTGSMFIHLTKDLESEIVPFVGEKHAGEKKQQLPETTSYGVDREVQKQLASIRTDLDSFSDAEAYALMMSAYLMTERSFLKEKCAPTLPLNPTTADWQFLRVREAVTQPKSDDNLRMRRLLKVSPMLAIKVWWQSKVLGGLAVAGALAAAAALLVTLILQWGSTPQWLQKTGAYLGNPDNLPTTGTLTLWALGIVALIGVRYFADKALHFQKRFGEFLLGVSLSTVGFVASWLHLTLFDQIFLWYGQWPEKKEGALPSAIAERGSPQMSIKASAPSAAPRKKEWTPVVRRILNMFPPPR
ncbi:MAG TPA: patatin-like phospholipase family protein [Thermoanaerobaculia bacterium]|nr:patatin-like phospholipase family protein [Thermoanaerobaculia bacterium]